VRNYSDFDVRVNQLHNGQLPHVMDVVMHVSRLLSTAVRFQDILLQARRPDVLQDCFLFTTLETMEKIILERQQSGSISRSNRTLNLQQEELNDQLLLDGNENRHFHDYSRTCFSAQATLTSMLSALAAHPSSPPTQTFPATLLVS
jgi:hypothetical protein